MRRRGWNIVLAVLGTLVLVLVATPTVGSAAGAGGATRTGAGVAVAGATDPTTTVCPKMAQTLATGMQKFVADMRKVSSQARASDLAGAQATVKQGGKVLVTVGTDLRAEGKTADDQQLKTAVNDLAAEFERLGKSLTDLTALQNFNTTKLEELGQKVSKLCGGSLTPQPSRTS